MTMEYRRLGSTGLSVSALAFGAGPEPATMTSEDPDAQVAVVARAIERGINWFDTAAGYGQGKSEAALGAALRTLGAADRVYIATKVRLGEDQLGDVAGAVNASVQSSLRRLGVGRVTLLQLHNSITARRGEEPTSLTPSDVLDQVLPAFEQLRRGGVVRHIGLTGIGQAEALRAVIRSGGFETLQIPYNLLNPSAGHPVPSSFPQTNYGNVIADCAEMRMGVFAIRVLAGGALAGNPPSAHTLKTPFFPVALYERDRARAGEMSRLLSPGMSAAEAAVRFALSNASVTSAIVGFSTAEQVDEAVEWGCRGALADSLVETILTKTTGP
jgi:L-galactose dehydrogenase/L-glyceraldehyde 3-phosphate reductase